MKTEVKEPICPINQYWEGDEDKCDTDKCDFDLEIRTCSEACNIQTYQYDRKFDYKIPGPTPESTGEVLMDALCRRCANDSACDAIIEASFIDVEHSNWWDELNCESLHELSKFVDKL